MDKTLCKPDWCLMILPELAFWWEKAAITK